MTHEIKLDWKGGMSFETELDGHKLSIDVPEEMGGKDGGPRPKKLMLVALAGCTGMDIASLLKKMRVEVDTFDIKVEAPLADEHPKYYTSMKVVYEFFGENVSEEKVTKIVNMSLDKYCGVSALYKKAIDFDFEIRINP